MGSSVVRHSIDKSYSAIVVRYRVLLEGGGGGGGGLQVALLTPT